MYGMTEEDPEHDHCNIETSVLFSSSPLSLLSRPFPFSTLSL